MILSCLRLYYCVLYVVNGVFVFSNFDCPIYELDMGIYMHSVG